METIRKSLWIKQAMLLTFMLTMVMASYGNTSIIGSNTVAHYVKEGLPTSGPTIVLPAFLGVNTLGVGLSAASAVISTVAVALQAAVASAAIHALDLFISVKDPEFVKMSKAMYDANDFTKYDN